MRNEQEFREWLKKDYQNHIRPVSYMSLLQKFANRIATILSDKLRLKRRRYILQTRITYYVEDPSTQTRHEMDYDIALDLADVCAVTSTKDGKAVVYMRSTNVAFNLHESYTTLVQLLIAMQE